MRGWVNWREIEKNNDWGSRSKSDATADMWDQDADGWEGRAQREHEHNIKQVALMQFDANDTVIDICCGTGPLTLLIAPKVKNITAMDYGKNMLAYVKKHADEQGLTNINYLQGNWYTMQPGIDFEPADIAVTRHSPVHTNIAAMSKAAKKYCYSVWDCAPYKLADSPHNRKGGFWIVSAENKDLNYTPRPDERLYGYNVSFNILYDMGANPTIGIARTVTEHKAATIDELREKVLPFKPGMDEERYLNMWQMFLPKVVIDKDGAYTYTNIRQTSVLGWDPNEVHFE